ncbi:MAG TPA: hypothetical protein VIV11_25520 [Kofleriaceae bacterium]
MSSLRFLLTLSLVACVAEPTVDDDMDLATDDATPISADKTDAPGWEAAATLHANTTLHDFADAGARHVHSLWVAGTSTTRVPLTISATADDSYDVRIAVLGPAVNGARVVLGADGYAERKRTVSVTINVSQPGEHLVIVGSHNLANHTSYALTATCTAATCTPARVDALASPKDFSLVGDSGRLISMQLGDALLDFNGDLEVELWASPPMQHWNAQHVATSYASGSQINVIAPSSIRWGDDIRLVLREPGGRVLDTGVTTRFLPVPTNLVRLDAILYGDIASLQIAGSVGFFEGQADLRLRSVTRNIELAQYTAHADRPGQVGNGFNAFDATFLPDLSVAAADGELLSIGSINGNGDFRRLGCFEYCNNLSGLSSCTGGPRTCPL